MKKIFIFFLIIIIAVSVFVFAKPKNFEDKRADLLNKLDENIKEAEKQGKYHCCIQPACTMCYLGNWIWDDGTCDCDAMIATGQLDKVCPQCKKGIEEGFCKSQTEVCDLTKDFAEAKGLNT